MGDLYTEDAVTVRVPGERRTLAGSVFTDGGPFVYTLVYLTAELTRVDAEFMDLYLSRQRGDDDGAPYASVAIACAPPIGRSTSASATYAAASVIADGRGEA